MTALLRPQRQPEPQARPSLRLVAGRSAGAGRSVAGRSAAGRRRLALVASGLLFAAVLAGNVSVYATTNQGQFELERLQHGTATREVRYQQLRLQVAQLQAPERVVERARQLGMIEAAKVTYLTPTASTSAGVPAPRPSVTDPATEAAQSWGQVKPQLDGRP